MEHLVRETATLVYHVMKEELKTGEPFVGVANLMLFTAEVFIKALEEDLPYHTYPEVITMTKAVEQRNEVLRQTHTVSSPYVPDVD